MHEYGKIFGDKVAEACISKFKSLGKTGKPKESTEWTLLACFIKEDHHKETLEVVALGTGSKCLGAQQLPSAGDVLHDSHAEVIARRAFMLYLLDQVEKASKSNISIFEQKDGKFALKSGISFHFYGSHTPCGDASIFPKQEWNECCEQNIEAIQEINSDSSCKKHDLEMDAPAHLNEDCTDIDNREPPIKKIKRNEVNVTELEDSKMNTFNNIIVKETTNVNKTEENSGNKYSKFVNSKAVDNARLFAENNIGNITAMPDIYRTGAKCVSGEKLDPKMPGSDYHVTGVLRTKPGRGDPTLSLSCSDKLFKWTVLGVQGALLMLFLEAPVYMKTITIGRCPFSQEAMERALFGRFKSKVSKIKLPDGFQIVTPLILYSEVDFPFSQGCIMGNALDASKVIPSPTSLIWSVSNTHCSKHEVATNGRKLGTTKKNQGTSKGWVSICRRSILQRVQTLGQEHSEVLSSPIDVHNFSYGDLKCQAENYCRAWKELKTHVLTNWTVKPSLVREFKI
ncbi:tRNA-specific adenosine deaminase 1 [Procambarus clarkii]|uniref:tRNA-specific adenosine deaminase 1 n=1 Tax=Procambarus clarkii TaxID=6728 RepID=UPI001E674A64|nr:tRNA-specific adenosine deaminase 1-like [Procambarus clarkii]